MGVQVCSVAYVSNFIAITLHFIDFETYIKQILYIYIYIKFLSVCKNMVNCEILLISCSFSM